MRIGSLITAAIASSALVATPTLAASRSLPVSAAAYTAFQDVETADDDDDDDEEGAYLPGKGGLFGGGALAFVLIAAIIAIGVYIVVDDDENEDPVSP